MTDSPPPSPDLAQALKAQLLVKSINLQRPKKKEDSPHRDNLSSNRAMKKKAAPMSSRKTAAKIEANDVGESDKEKWTHYDIP